ncbi:MAG: 50S ribosomal protein L2 [Parcubacteria group bacterium CG_4_9_14_0_2_um_filter_41_8]|nr:MAG: 50S ribosomal protein L2 [Parcubacteria group bacterium CG1_02_41_12]PIP67429.1 MAG: 50S ribosomal protein L2 [Parcubacteria group bacterium CG22_combo_CG10-13_8_21_14_all_41_9]PIQ79372.1 MAG: 50S ribosomal protein L2 [Parcubacteria group bacterium CG11_big_fil_rev_8_21_14_0_20_41_14]PIR56712.1 MAG: 50S ribosomal protein L2 [Parcubacteria group bacterium CG10_big_fil_rev_8_21_14_0_10_41_35]PIZ77722.1 MAG: 50S ribosomal protein L2 [Parcubacteria group bacterium CG_4_10_14_0_2_um_filter_4
MSIKRYKPTTSGRRHASVIKRDKIGEQKRVKKLIQKLPYRAGRSNGKISVRHKGNRAKRAYRMIDFSNPVEDKKAEVIGIQYDPYRTADIALLKYEDGSLSYTLAVQNLKLGDIIETSRKRSLDMNPGNRMILKHIPAGVMICNIELSPKSKASSVRSAGSSATVLSQEPPFVQVKMPSSEVRKFNENCLITIGQVSNPEHSLIRLGKAGRKRHMGIRPTVRGKAMNPVDHPHGGGEARNSIGLKQPKTPWGKKALGVKTRKPNKASNTLIIRRRKKK